MNDRTYEDPRTIIQDREASYRDYLERRHKRTYPLLYWQQHHENDEPPNAERSMVSAVERMHAENRRWCQVVAANGCCEAHSHEVLVIDRWTDASGVKHERERMAKRDGWCPNYKAMCPRLDEATRAVRFCKALLEFIESQTEEA